MLIILLTAFLGVLEAATPVSAEATKDLETSEISGIAISGDAGSIRITTDAAKPYVATLTGRRTGWFSAWYSSWSFESCDSGSDMHIENGTLKVQLRSGSWHDLSECVVEINANLPAGSAVGMTVSAVEARLAGSFNAVALNSRAADFQLTGHARAVLLKSDAMRADLDFETVTHDEDVSIDVRNLDATVTLRPQTPISYSVRTIASYVDSALANTPGAKPHFDFTADHARIRIR